MPASYLVSMTVDPVLSMRLLRTRTRDGEPDKPRSAVGRVMARLEHSSEDLMSRLDTGYQRILDVALQRRRWVILSITALFVISLGAARFIGSEFFPATDESQFEVLVQEPQGTAVQVTSATAETAPQVIHQVVPRQYITPMTTNAAVSRGFAFGSHVGANYAQVNVRLIPPL